MIEVIRLSKQFGPKLAVDNISFSVAKGEVLGFLGPNGAGKSTTMRMITGFIPPTRGTVTVGGLASGAGFGIAFLLRWNRRPRDRYLTLPQLLAALRPAPAAAPAVAPATPRRHPPPPPRPTASSWRGSR